MSPENIIRKPPNYIYIVEDSKTSRSMCEDLLGYSHEQAK
jgi:hypothetical protein